MSQSLMPPAHLSAAKQKDDEDFADFMKAAPHYVESRQKQPAASVASSDTESATHSFISRSTRKSLDRVLNNVDPRSNEGERPAVEKKRGRGLISLLGNLARRNRNKPEVSLIEWRVHASCHLRAIRRGPKHRVKAPNSLPQRYVSQG